MDEEQAGISKSTEGSRPSENSIKVEGVEEARGNIEAIWKIFDEKLVSPEGRMRYLRGLKGSNGWEFYYIGTTPDHLDLQKKVKGSRDVFSSQLTLIRRNPGYVRFIDVSNLPLDEESLAARYEEKKSGDAQRGWGKEPKEIESGIALELELEGDNVKNPVVNKAIALRRPKSAFGKIPYQVSWYVSDKTPFTQEHFNQLRSRLSEAAKDVQDIAGQAK